MESFHFGSSFAIKLMFAAAFVYVFVRFFIPHAVCGVPLPL